MSLLRTLPQTTVLTYIKKLLVHRACDYFVFLWKGCFFSFVISKWTTKADILGLFGKGLHSVCSIGYRLALRPGQSHHSERSVWVINCIFWLKKSEKQQKLDHCPWVSTKLIYKGKLFIKSLGLIICK